MKPLTVNPTSVFNTRLAVVSLRAVGTKGRYCSGRKVADYVFDYAFMPLHP